MSVGCCCVLTLICGVEGVEVDVASSLPWLITALTLPLPLPLPRLVIAPVVSDEDNDPPKNGYAARAALFPAWAPANSAAAKAAEPDVIPLPRVDIGPLARDPLGLPRLLPVPRLGIPNGLCKSGVDEALDGVLDGVLPSSTTNRPSLLSSSCAIVNELNDC